MDPIADMLTRIRNGYRARKASVPLPYSALKAEIARVLAERGYIAGSEKKGRKVRKFLEVQLRYDGTEPAMSGARRLSRPSRRLYIHAEDIRPVRQGFGLLIVSTPKGVRAGEEARKANVGGELIAEVW